MRAPSVASLVICALSTMAVAAMLFTPSFAQEKKLRRSISRWQITR